MKEVCDPETTIRLAEKILNKVLLIGMVAAIVLIIVGLWLYSNSGEMDFKDNASWEELASFISSAEPEGLLTIAIVLIAATPIVRVITSLAIFSLKRELILALLSLTVIAIIFLGFVLETR